MGYNRRNAPAIGSMPPGGAYYYKVRLRAQALGW